MDFLAAVSLQNPNLQFTSSHFLIENIEERIERLGLGLEPIVIAYIKIQHSSSRLHSLAILFIPITQLFWQFLHMELKEFNVLN